MTTHCEILSLAFLWNLSKLSIDSISKQKMEWLKRQNVGKYWGRRVTNQRNVLLKWNFLSKFELFQIKYFWWYRLNGFLILPVNVLGWWKLCRSFDSPQQLFNMNSGHQFSFLISQSKTLSRQAGRQNQNQQYFIINNEYYEQMNTFLHHSLNPTFEL